MAEEGGLVSVAKRIAGSFIEAELTEEKELEGREVVGVAKTCLLC
jgi:hypothetical protein